MTKVLRVFTSRTCGPCQTMKPMFEALGNKVEMVDVQFDPTLVARHRVRSVPTLQKLEDGMVAATYVGSMTQSELDMFLK